MFHKLFYTINPGEPKVWKHILGLEVFECHNSKTYCAKKRPNCWSKSPDRLLRVFRCPSGGDVSLWLSLASLSPPVSSLSYGGSCSVAGGRNLFVLEGVERWEVTVATRAESFGGNGRGDVQGFKWAFKVESCPPALTDAGWSLCRGSERKWDDKQERAIKRVLYKCLWQQSL